MDTETKALLDSFNYSSPESEVKLISGKFTSTSYTVKQWIFIMDITLESYIKTLYAMIECNQYEVLRVTKRSEGQDTLVIAKINKVEDYGKKK